MSATTLRREESLGLALAVVGHAALFAWMIWQKPAAPPPPPERMTVTISDEVGLTSAAPAPQVEAAPDKGPEIGEAPPPPAPEPVPVAKPAPVPPRPVPAPAKIAAKPAAQPVKPATKPAQTATKLQPQNPTKSGSSSFDDAFSRGIPKSKGQAQTPPAQITGAVRSSLAGAISRELKPKWRGRAPTGIDSEKLVTYLTWDLNPDGTLAGTPRVVRQEGITPSNKAQAGRHAEEAIRAVRLAAPFDLPPQYYVAWKRIAEFRFDRRLGE